MLAKAHANPFFAVDGYDPADGEGELVMGAEDEKVGDHWVKHQGRGRFAVLLGDAVGGAGLSKTQAEDHARELSEGA
ncbi:hypothetical protein OPKNFCMD_6862 [Methylobacterium crusticola]|uniref:Uncharacterized protein n=1 Tax=Methylobacterium crusticola TaxID=1697972 RepID=A0ABQ4RBB6_9HYPH|nr:hypothetical protein [Methylobacterium crusticola]GJD54081.1 hypothetical protein OPKNFCMD_6862 [Methylobacterium crusticola]